MIELAHFITEITVIVFAFTLSFYCFRLVKSYFKGGVFAPAFKIFGAASLLFAITYVVDVGLDLAAIKIPAFGLLHHILNALFVVGLFYGTKTLYQAWVRLGGK